MVKVTSGYTEWILTELHQTENNMCQPCGGGDTQFKMSNYTRFTLAKHPERWHDLITD